VVLDQSGALVEVHDMPTLQDGPAGGFLADEPILGEPVSASQFPANREFNREFFKFGPFSAILAPNQPANSNACGKIP
jgi:hypothetical protein